MYGTLMVAARMVLNKYAKSPREFCESKKDKYYAKILEVYNMLYKHFGDSLSICSMPSICDELEQDLANTESPGRQPPFQDMLSY